MRLLNSATAGDSPDERATHNEARQLATGTS
jgi:hypothetical protein